MLFRLVPFVVAISALAATANAQPAARGLAACRTDMATFCTGIEAGGGKRVACLIANKDKLSAECSAAIQQRAAQAPTGAKPGPGAPGSSVAPPAAPPSAPAPGAPLQSTTPAPVVKGAKAGKGGRMAACRTDLQSLCASIPAGGGAKVRCLQENQTKLSPACAQSMGELRSAKQATRGACLVDAKTLCPGLKGDQRRTCFTENQAKLSPECSAAFGKRAAR